MFNKNKVVGNAMIIYTDKNYESDIVIKNKHESITLTTEEFLGLSQFFWKTWSIARVRSELGAKNSKEAEKKISGIAEKLSYW